MEWIKASSLFPKGVVHVKCSNKLNPTTIMKGVGLFYKHDNFVIRFLNGTIINQSSIDLNNVEWLYEIDKH